MMKDVESEHAAVHAGELARAVRVCERSPGREKFAATEKLAHSS